jgi:hypothetical protein
MNRLAGAMNAFQVGRGGAGDRRVGQSGLCRRPPGFPALTRA